jgi:hypothetical protein
MPMIQLTLPAGVLAEQTRHELDATLVASLLTWEGAPDTPVFQAQARSRVVGVNGDTFSMLEDDAPRASGST